MIKIESTVKGSIMWTAAKENSCGNKFEWCSTKLFFHLNPELAWKQQQNILRSDKCVTFELDRDAKNGLLGLSNCKTRNRIVCEVLISIQTHRKKYNLKKYNFLQARPRPENNGMEIVKECQALYKISNSNSAHLKVQAKK